MVCDVAYIDDGREEAKLSEKDLEGNEGGKNVAAEIGRISSGRNVHYFVDGKLCFRACALTAPR